MVRIRPSIDEEELNRKLRHACPRIKRWKNRIDEADGDVHRMREQSINRSPVYVAIQRGSRNIQIRSRTTPKWWRKWIQEGKKHGFDESFATPIHIPSEAYKYQRQISLSKKSPEKSPRRSLPVSPVKSRIHSPVKVSYLRNEEHLQTSRKIYPQKGVPMLTLTPVPLNQVLKRKAKIVGNISATFGKGRWVEQDPTMLAVPGSQVFQYDSSSETEDEIQRKGGEILNRLIKQTPPSPVDTMKRLASAKRRETATPPKSPKRSPKKESQQQEEEFEEYYSPSSQRIKKKIRAAGQTSLYFSPNRKLDDGDVVEESEEEAGHRSARDKSATIRKMRAVGTTKAALSPHKSPKKSPESSPRTPGSMKKKIRAIGKTSAAFSPNKDRNEEFMVDEDGNIVSPGRGITQDSSPSSVGSFFRKIKILSRLSSPSRGPDASPSSISSLMTKMRFLTKISPRRKRKQSQEATEETEDEGEEDKAPRKKETSEEEEEAADEEEDEEEKESCLRITFRIVCPCIARKKDPELMEYQSGSQAEF